MSGRGESKRHPTMHSTTYAPLPALTAGVSGALRRVSAIDSYLPLGAASRRRRACASSMRAGAGASHEGSNLAAARCSRRADGAQALTPSDSASAERSASGSMGLRSSARMPERLSSAASMPSPNPL